MPGVDFDVDLEIVDICGEGTELVCRVDLEDDAEDNGENGTERWVEDEIRVLAREESDTRARGSKDGACNRGDDDRTGGAGDRTATVGVAVPMSRLRTRFANALSMNRKYITCASIDGILYEFKTLDLQE